MSQQNPSLALGGSSFLRPILEVLDLEFIQTSSPSFRELFNTPFASAWMLLLVPVFSRARPRPKAGGLQCFCESPLQARIEKDMKVSCFTRVIIWALINILSQNGHSSRKKKYLSRIVRPPFAEPFCRSLSRKKSYFREAFANHFGSTSMVILY